MKMAWHIHKWAHHAIFTSSLTSTSSLLNLSNVHGVQHNIVEVCSHQPGTTCAFLAVYAMIAISTLKNNISSKLAKYVQYFGFCDTARMPLSVLAQSH